MRPYGQQRTRLLCPQDSLGKNTGVGCHFLLPQSSGLHSSLTCASPHGHTCTHILTHCPGSGRAPQGNLKSCNLPFNNHLNTWSLFPFKRSRVPSTSHHGSKFFIRTWNKDRERSHRQHVFNLRYSKILISWRLLEPVNKYGWYITSKKINDWWIDRLL